MKNKNNRDNSFEFVAGEGNMDLKIKILCYNFRNKLKIWSN